MMYRPTAYTGGNIERYLTQELDRISAALSEMYMSHIRLQKLNAAPDKPLDGMVVKADGTNWNPGGGAGVYVYIGGTGWVKL